MPIPPPPSRRSKAKATLAAATGEVHDRLVEAGKAPEDVAIRQLSETERKRAGLDASDNDKRASARRKVQAEGRRWVKARKIP